ncbi:MAG: pirin-like C-terminal cupin domain-containing protein, partial [Sphingomonas sp.]
AVDVPEWHLAALTDGEGVSVTSEAGCTLLYGHADPIGEPVVAHGPFVMNSEAEIVQAIRDYQRGLFGDPAAIAG